MADNNLDFQTKVKAAAKFLNTSGIHRCYGTSNCAKFVTGGFLCGIPNIGNLDESAEALCVFSKIQLSPNSELHTAIVVRNNLEALLVRLKAMAAMPGEFFADKNNNCALFLWSDGNVYPYNKAKVTFELTPDILKKLGPGVEPDTLYWAVYGSEKDAEGGAVAELAHLVGQAKFKRLPALKFAEATSPSLPSAEGLTSILTDFREACNSVEFVTSLKLVQRYTASLLAKRFLILTGLAGSGKTKIAQAFSQWLAPSNEFCEVVPVGADWTGSESILGYPDGLQATNYVAKPALELILHAADYADVPHFLILDEMNLSHVERYFADVLSIIESDEGLELYSGDMTKPETWRKTSASKPVPPKLKRLPENLFIIGTVNVDETTYMFSPKVLDRANVIEFRMDATELEGFLANPAKPDLLKLDGKGASFGKAFVDAAKNPAAVPADVKAPYDAEMLLLFKTLQADGAEFGYRTAYETARFIHFYKLLGNCPDIPDGTPQGRTWFDDAFDCVIFQKLLPKLHGSRAKLGPVLKKLWFLCVNGAAGRDADALKAAEEAARSTDKKGEPSVIVPADAPYPLSAEKIGRMWRLLIENGFASFAEA
jgi:5-methylcytosine-specific restriction protein B